MALKIVFDTSVLVAAARSRSGASFALLKEIPSERFQVCLSYPLFLEWQDVLCRSEHLPPGLQPDDARRFLQYLASQCHPTEIHFTLRPFLRDPNDDMVLELAFASGSQYIITHNVRDFRGMERLGIEALTPRQFLQILNPRL